ncbi:MAG: OadG family protein [Clostridiales bacterium]|nr:OadG family protein [Clostridiales bacterium]
MMDIIRYASENGGETFTLFQPQMGTGDMLMNAGTVMLVVFGVLFLMYILISLSGKVIAGISGQVIGASKKEEPKAEVKAAPAAQTKAEDPGEEFSSGTLKLKGCDEKTAAMIMAIVSDNTGIPLSELVFKSIKLVDEK